MIKDAIIKLAEGQNLEHGEAKELFMGMLDASISPPQVASILTALRMKGESVEEIRALAEVMREKAVKLKVRNNVLDIDREDINADEETIIDTCGTGGKKTKTFNISTCTAFVLASAGIKVAKHGNRSFSGVCGSADVVEGLGIRIDASPEEVQEAVKKVGIGFLYAPLYHPAMKNVGPIRKDLGIRTIFNLVGPLSNPAQASKQVLGVYDKGLTEKIASVLNNLGLCRAFVVWGQDVYDEVSTTGKTQISEVNKGEVKTFFVNPDDFGLKKTDISQLKGGDVEDNVESVLSVLKGEPSPKLDIVLANAAVCFVLVDKAGNFREGVELARDYIGTGKAFNKFQELKDFMKKVR